MGWQFVVSWVEVCLYDCPDAEKYARTENRKVIKEMPLFCSHFDQEPYVLCRKTCSNHRTKIKLFRRQPSRLREIVGSLLCCLLRGQIGIYQRKYTIENDFSQGVELQGVVLDSLINRMLRFEANVRPEGIETMVSLSLKDIAAQAGVSFQMVKRFSKEKVFFP